jgi:hypothetical protein
MCKGRGTHADQPGSLERNLNGGDDTQIIPFEKYYGHETSGGYKN